MLDFTLSFLTLVIIFLITVVILVKLYRNGVKPWMVHTAIVLFTLFFIALQPFELTTGLFEAYLAVLFATIFANDTPPLPKKSNEVETYDESEDEPKEQHRSESLSESLMSMVLLYGLFDFFDDGDDW